MKSCKTCIHFRPSVESGCRLHDRAALLQLGHVLPEIGPPDPATFVCDDWEPP